MTSRFSSTAATMSLSERFRSHIYKACSDTTKFTSTPAEASAASGCPIDHDACRGGGAAADPIRIHNYMASPGFNSILVQIFTF